MAVQYCEDISIQPIPLIQEFRTIRKQANIAWHTTSSSAIALTTSP